MNNLERLVYTVGHSNSDSRMWNEKKKKISICGSYLASFLAGTLKQEIIIVNADVSVLKQKLEKSHLYL